MKPLFYFMIFFIGSNAWGAGGDDHGGVPIVVLYQAINVGTLLFLLVFLLKNKVSAALKNRKESHEGKVQDALRVVQEAEKRNAEIKNKIKTVETSKEKTLEEARLNAEQLKLKIIEEARLQAEQMKKDAERSIQYELERAKNELRTELLEEVMSLSRQNISKNINSGKQASLNKEFVDGIRLN